MQTTATHRFVIEFLAGEGGGVAASRELTAIDWLPIRQDFDFRNFREGSAACPDPLRIAPRWDSRQGRPLVAGIEAIPAGGGRPEEYPLDIFESDAARLNTRLVEESVLDGDASYSWRVAAYPAAAPRPAETGGDFQVETEHAEPPVLNNALLEEAVDVTAPVVDADYAYGGDIPVFLPRSVLAEATAQAARADGVETGGVLIGNLLRASEGTGLGVVITARIPAPHTLQASASLTFTPETWSAVEDAITLRGTRESYLGWDHLHPAESAWCKNCPLERKKLCALQTGFFSEADRHLHRAVFPQPWAVGLLVVETWEGMRLALFGWRRGTVQRRAFQIVETINQPRRSSLLASA